MKTRPTGRRAGLSMMMMLMMGGMSLLPLLMGMGGEGGGMLGGLLGGGKKEEKKAPASVDGRDVTAPRPLPSLPRLERKPRAPVTSSSTADAVSGAAGNRTASVVRGLSPSAPQPSAAPATKEVAAMDRAVKAAYMQVRAAVKTGDSRKMRVAMEQYRDAQRALAETKQRVAAR